MSAERNRATGRTRPPTAHEAEICVVGAGAAGCFLSYALARQGLRTIVIEAGGGDTATAADIGMMTEFSRDVYSGAREGRFFGLGGSTIQWGGLLAPHTNLDLRRDDPHDVVWRRIVETVNVESTEVLETLGYRDGNDFADRASAIGKAAQNALSLSGIAALAALHLPFRRKNLRCLIDSATKQSIPPKVLTGATAVAWDKGHLRSMEAVRVHTDGGQEVIVRARHFIIAAGALESARILLELKADWASDFFPATALIGTGLSDHLSVAIADVATQDRPLAAQLFGPRFDGAWMRTVRLIAKSCYKSTPRSFAHFTFGMESDGFRVARKLLQAMQRRARPDIGLIEAARGATDLTKIAWTKITQKRLYVAPDAPVHLQLDIEQTASPANRLRLGSRRDKHGRLIPVIDWHISEEDLTRTARTASLYLEAWRKAGSLLPVLVPRPLSPATTKPHDAYHPAGLTRMGNDPSAVVDQELKVHGFDNLFVVSTGVLPTPGTANPTFTMLCMANRLARRLGEDLRRSKLTAHVAVAA
jgi:choline dehydrogenase-like flavoprotein